MPRRTSRRGLQESALAAMLGLPLEELQRLLRSARPIRQRGLERWFEWNDIRKFLSDEVLQGVRKQLAAKRAVLGTSKRWVGGYPELVAQWDWRKNVNLIPDDVSFGSHLEIWWRCDNGPDHEWQARAQSRTRQKGCPFCAGKRVSITNCLSTRHPLVAKQWHPVKNGNLTARDFVWSSNHQVWWKCSGGPDHEWRAKINGRTSGHKGCPFCARTRPSITNSLASLFPEAAREWHPTLNGSLTPDNVTTCSNRTVWWLCKRSADHEWEAKVESRSLGSGCPYCSGNLTSISNCLAVRIPRVANEWHPTKNGVLTPHDFSWSSSHEVWWKCPKGADHEWRARISSRTSKNSGCPFCAGHRPSISNCLATLSPQIAREWHAKLNRPLTARRVTTGSHRLIWWQCKRNPRHLWRTAVYRRASGAGCPFCHRAGLSAR